MIVDTSELTHNIPPELMKEQDLTGLATVPPGSDISGYVLIADDDPGVHRLLGLILQRLSLEIRSALNGYEALEMIAACRPSLLVLDLQMPGLGGLEVLAQLGQVEETARIPVMIYSAGVRAAQHEGYQWPSQVVEILEKASVRPSELRAIVKSRLGL